MDLAKGLLGSEDLRALPNSADHANFIKLSRLLKGLFVDRPFRDSPGNWTRGRKIDGLVEYAGRQEFVDKDGTKWTVKVNLLLSRGKLLI